MKMKGKTAIVGLAVVGLLTTTGIGTALAERGSYEEPAGPDVVTDRNLSGPEAADVLIFVDLATIVDVLGLGPEEIDAQVMQGKSLAEIAGQEKTPELIDAIVNANQERIESERAAGRLSDEEAAEAINGLREQVTQLVTTEGPTGPNPSVRPIEDPTSDGEAAPQT